MAAHRWVELVPGVVVEEFHLVANVNLHIRSFLAVVIVVVVV